MKIKIIQDCRLAMLPHEPQLVFGKDQEVEVSNAVGAALITAKHAVEIEVGSGNPANDDGFNEKAMDPNYENKSLGDQKKFRNKSKFTDGAK